MSSKSQSQEHSQRQGWFIRPSVEESDYMSGSFELNGVQSFVYLSADGSLAVHKRLKDGSPSSKPLATGRVRRNPSTNPEAPALLGNIHTGKGTKFDVALWWYADAGGEPPRPYYVIRYDEYKRPEPKGKVFSPEALPA